MRAIIALAFAGLTASAAAAPVGYDFRVGITDGPLAGQELTGSFVIDGSYLEANRDAFDPAGLGIDSIDFGFAGASFSRANADAVFLLTENGRLIDFILGGAPSGFDLIDSSDFQADFILDSFGFGYKLAGADQFSFGGTLLRLYRVSAAPAYALFGLSLLPLAFRRRRA